MLKLHAGVSKKVGLPSFSSASASSNIEAELDGSLLHDREGFQTVVQEVIEVRTSPAINGTRITTTINSLPSPRPATASQVRALLAIAARRKIVLMGLLLNSPAASVQGRVLGVEEEIRGEMNSYQWYLRGMCDEATIAFDVSPQTLVCDLMQLLRG